MTSSRSLSYSIDEDMHLCHVYLDVSQNPIIGINQSKDQFWARVETEYQKSEISNQQPRPRRSLQTRMTTILSAVSKLRGCVNQIENKNPSGASEQDILNQAKMLLAQDVKYKRGFKFDHVWPILKGMEKFTNNNGNAPSAFHEEGRNISSSPSFSVDPESSPSPGMNSFDLNINSDEGTSNLSSRPMGVKKAKRKLQSEEQFKQLMEQNDKLLKAITKDLNSITDPASRAYIENRKQEIIRKRAQTSQSNEQGEDVQYQYHGSQYRTSQYQGDQAEGQPSHREQVQENDEEEFEKEPLIDSSSEKSGKVMRLKDDVSADHRQTLAFHLKPKVVELKVSMHCYGCAKKVEKHISKLDGVTWYKVELESKKVVVKGNIMPVDVLESICKVKNAQLWSSS
ncbi:Uncharacterized protein Rs2_52517 [Raphanus sativus]|nr:Uncharacterized protein Rs2_52517 [Raphanus sativus]